MVCAFWSCVVGYVKFWCVAGVQDGGPSGGREARKGTTAGGSGQPPHNERVRVRSYHNTAEIFYLQSAPACGILYAWQWCQQE